MLFATKPKSLSEKILCLLYDYTPIKLTAKQIKNLLGSKHHKQNIKTALDGLIQRDIVERTAFRPRRYEYGLQLNLLEKSLSSIKHKLEKYKQFAVTKPILEESRQKEQAFSFCSLRELYDFLDNLENQWMTSYSFPYIVYHEYFNLECLRPISPARNTAYYVLYQRDDFSSCLRQGKWANRRVFFQLHNASLSYSTRIFGDFLVTITYPKDTLAKIESILNAMGASGLLTSIFEITGVFKVTLQYNPKEASRQRESFTERWASIGFKDLITTLNEQKTKGLPLVIGSQFAYISKEQVQLMYDCDKKTKSILATQEEVKRLLSVLPPFIINHFKNGNIAVVDLGVGPVAKPIPLFWHLNKKFENIEYIAVDYSKNILEEAKSTIQKYVPGLSTEFVKLDLLSLSVRPEKLLLKIHNTQRVYLFIGSTYGNFSHEKVKSFISSLLQKGDILVVDNETLSNEKELQDIKKRYPEKVEFNLQPLLALGFSIEDLQVEYKYEKFVIEVFAIIKNIPKTLITPIQNIGLEKDDKIRIFSARKPSPEVFEEEIASLTNGLIIERHTFGTHSIIIAKKEF